MIKFLFLLTATLAVSACSHSVILPGSLNQTPAVAGRLGKGQINIALEKTVEVEVFSDYTSNPPIRTDAANPTLFEALLPVLPTLNGSLGLLENIDLYYTGSTGLRWMFWKQDGSDFWRATLFAGVVGQGNTSSSQTSSSCTPECRAVTRFDGAEFGFSIGRNLEDNRLLYLTYGQQRMGGETKITQPGRTFNYDDRFEHQILSVGISYGDKVFFTVELGLTSTTIRFDEGGSESHSSGTGLLALGLQF